MNFVTLGSLQAEVLHWAQNCKKGELIISNNSPQTQRFWLQKFSPTLIAESEVAVDSGKSVKVKLAHQKSSDRFSLLHFNPSSSIQNMHFAYSCGSKNYFLSALSGGMQTYRKLNPTQEIFHLQNLTTANNQVVIENLDRTLQVTSKTTLMLRSGEAKNITRKIDASTFFIRISSGASLAQFQLTSTGAQGPLILQPQVTVVDNQAHYFEVGSRDGLDDSFIIKIQDPAMIAKAQEQISNPQLEKIIFAKIQKGSAGFNRNLKTRTKNLWNWSTTEVTSFSDLGSTTCNGVPQFVEDRIDSWQKDPGRICFWGYRIKRELTAEEVSTGQDLQ